MFFKKKTEDEIFFAEIEKDFNSERWPYCPVWDQMLNELLDKHKIIEVRKAVVVFENGVEVWIENKWFAFGRPDKPVIADITPSSETKLRLYKTVGDRIPDALAEIRKLM